MNTNQDLKDMPDEYWKSKLTPEQYEVLRLKSTETPFSGELVDMHDDGSYHCAGCGNKLFNSDTKFESNSGWPSFYDAIDESAVEFESDTSGGTRRIEVMCARCGGHLGHVFPDGPQPTGQRYCINSAALNFKPTEG